MELTLTALLDEKLGIDGFHDTDFCHLAGRVDINMREKKEFQWATKFVLFVSKTSKLINWGQAWHIFFKVQLKTFKRNNMLIYVSDCSSHAYRWF